MLYANVCDVLNDILKEMTSALNDLLLMLKIEILKCQVWQSVWKKIKKIQSILISGIANCAHWTVFKIKHFLSKVLDTFDGKFSYHSISRISSI